MTKDDKSAREKSASYGSLMASGVARPVLYRVAQNLSDVDAMNWPSKVVTTGTRERMVKPATEFGAGFFVGDE